MDFPHPVIVLRVVECRFLVSIQLHHYQWHLDQHLRFLEVEKIHWLYERNGELEFGLKQFVHAVEIIRATM